ncbi:hypothetical protein NMY22_g10306 [Coprinellus aureogranulatus]|nr:hypothetical protein NMY22_g10306 [Coprinellus aureogranulatus]
MLSIRLPRSMWNEKTIQICEHLVNAYLRWERRTRRPAAVATFYLRSMRVWEAHSIRLGKTTGVSFVGPRFEVRFLLSDLSSPGSPTGNPPRVQIGTQFGEARRSPCNSGELLV